MGFEECVEKSGINVALAAITPLSPSGRPPLSQEAADLAIAIAQAEPVPAALICFTHLCENSFGIRPAMPNVNGRPSSPWNFDVGPFQLSVQWAMRGVFDGNFTAQGLYFKDCFGPRFYEDDGVTPCAFSGDPLANGRLAARRLFAVSGTNRFRAVKYTGPLHQLKRGELYDSLMPYFENLFRLYEG